MKTLKQLVFLIFLTGLIVTTLFLAAGISVVLEGNSAAIGRVVVIAIIWAGFLTVCYKLFKEFRREARSLETNYNKFTRNGQYFIDNKVENKVNGTVTFDAGAQEIFFQSNEVQRTIKFHEVVKIRLPRGAARDEVKLGLQSGEVVTFGFYQIEDIIYAVYGGSGSVKTSLIKSIFFPPAPMAYRKVLQDNQYDLEATYNSSSEQLHAWLKKNKTLPYRRLLSPREFAAVSIVLYPFAIMLIIGILISIADLF